MVCPQMRLKAYDKRSNYKGGGVHDVDVRTVLVNGVSDSDDLKQTAAEGGKKIPRAASKVKTSKGQEMSMIGRIQSQVSGLLGGGEANKNANKVAPEGEGIWAEVDVDELVESARSGRFSGF